MSFAGEIKFPARERGERASFEQLAGMVRQRRGRGGTCQREGCLWWCGGQAAVTGWVRTAPRGSVPKPSDKRDAGTREQAAANLSAWRARQEFFSKGIRSIVGLFITSQARLDTMANKRQVNKPKCVSPFLNLSISLPNFLQHEPEGSAKMA